MLYYESHITIDPVFDEVRTACEAIIKEHKFKLAKLFMRKDVMSRDDTFMTGHSTDYYDIHERTKACVKTLQDNGFVVRRYKIEEAIVDSRIHDIWGMIPPEKQQIEQQKLKSYA